MTLEHDELLTTRQVADLLNVNRARVYEFIDMGLLEAIDLNGGAGRGRSIRIRRSAVAEYLEKCRVRPEAKVKQEVRPLYRSAVRLKRSTPRANRETGHA